MKADLCEQEQVPEHAFSLSAFGFPEPDGLGVPQPPSRWYLWFFGGAVVSLGVGIFWLRRIRRRQAGAPPAVAPALLRPQGKDRRGTAH